MWHALAPTQEGSVGKGVITDGWVTVIEGLIDPVVSQSLNRAMGKNSEKQNLWIF
jgi:C4-type Zn-finger protein